MSGIRSDPNADGTITQPPLSQPVSDQICIQREVLRQGAFVAVVVIVCAILLYFGLRGCVRWTSKRCKSWWSRNEHDSGSESSSGSESDGDEVVPTTTKATVRKRT